VLAAVDLDDQVVVIELCIGMSGLAVWIPAQNLPAWWGQIVRTTHLQQINLITAMRAAARMSGSLLYESPSWQVSAPVRYLDEVLCPDESLLDTGGDNLSSLLLVSSPRRGIDNGAGDACASWSSRWVDVLWSEEPRAVHPSHGWWGSPGR